MRRRRGCGQAGKGWGRQMGQTGKRRRLEGAEMEGAERGMLVDGRQWVGVAGLGLVGVALTVEGVA